MHILPGAGQVSGLAVDSQSTVYVLPRGLAHHADGRLDSLPALAGASLVRNGGDFWVARREVYSDTGFLSEPRGALIHYRNGESIRYDTANSCLDGNLFAILGQDSRGRLVVDQRYFYMLGGPSTGVIRFDGTVCEPIGLGLEGEMGAIAYARDSAGREYFATRMISDVPICGQALRRDSAGLDTLATGVCIDKLAGRGGEVWGAGNGIWIFSDRGVRKLAKLKGRSIPKVHDILFDSRGVAWIGTEGYASGPDPIGLASISGPDTVIYNQDNSAFPGYFASALAEDGKGNVWVGSWSEGVAVFARDKSVLALSPAAPARSGPRAGKAGSHRDLLGRRHRPIRAPSMPEAALFPAAP